MTTRLHRFYKNKLGQLNSKDLEQMWPDTKVEWYDKSVELGNEPEVTTQQDESYLSDGSEWDYIPGETILQALSEALGIKIQLANAVEEIQYGVDHEIIHGPIADRANELYSVTYYIVNHPRYGLSLYEGERLDDRAFDLSESSGIYDSPGELADLMLRDILNQSIAQEELVLANMNNASVNCVDESISAPGLQLTPDEEFPGGEQPQSKNNLPEIDHGRMRRTEGQIKLNELSEYSQPIYDSLVEHGDEPKLEDISDPNTQPEQPDIWVEGQVSVGFIGSEPWVRVIQPSGHELHIQYFNQSYSISTYGSKYDFMVRFTTADEGHDFVEIMEDWDRPDVESGFNFMDISDINIIKKVMEKLDLDKIWNRPGHQFVNINQAFNDITAKVAAEHTSAILALVPTEEASSAISTHFGDLLNNSDPLHITLVYLGKNLDTSKLNDVLQTVCDAYDPLECKLQGLGIFNHESDGGRPFYCSVDAIGLSEFRTALVLAASEVGVEIPEDYDFTPHMTIAYTDQLEDIDLETGAPEVSWVSNKLILMNGDDHTEFMLGGQSKQAQVTLKDMDKWPEETKVTYDRGIELGKEPVEESNVIPPLSYYESKLGQELKLPNGSKFIINKLDGTVGDYSIRMSVYLQEGKLTIGRDYNVDRGMFSIWLNNKPIDGVGRLPSIAPGGIDTLVDAAIEEYIVAIHHSLSGSWFDGQTYFKDGRLQRNVDTTQLLESDNFDLESKQAAPITVKDLPGDMDKVYDQMEETEGVELSDNWTDLPDLKQLPSETIKIFKEGIVDGILWRGFVTTKAGVDQRTYVSDDGTSVDYDSFGQTPNVFLSNGQEWKFEGLFQYIDRSKIQPLDDFDMDIIRSGISDGEDVQDPHEITGKSAGGSGLSLHELITPSLGQGGIDDPADNHETENISEDPDLKLGDVEAPYADSSGPLSFRFDDDKRMNITKGAQKKVPLTDLSDDMKVVYDQMVENEGEPKIEELSERTIYDTLRKNRPVERYEPSDATKIIDTAAGPAYIHTLYNSTSVFFLEAFIGFNVQTSSTSYYYQRDKNYTTPKFTKFEIYQNNVAHYMQQGRRGTRQPSQIELELANFLAKYVSIPVNAKTRPGVNKGLEQILRLASIKTSQLQVSDRYDVLGPPNGCKGQCEGTGLIPICEGDSNETLAKLWEAAEADSHAEDGWHFVKCPDCSTPDKSAVGIPDIEPNENISGNDYGRQDMAIPRDPAVEDILY